MLLADNLGERMRPRRNALQGKFTMANAPSLALRRVGSSELAARRLVYREVPRFARMTDQRDWLS
jgi:hypothetical protein